MQPEPIVLGQFLDTIGDLEVALRVLESDIACSELSVLCQHIGGRVRIIEIACEDVGTFDPQLTGGAGRKGSFRRSRADNASCRSVTAFRLM